MKVSNKYLRTLRLNGVVKYTQTCGPGGKSCTICDIEYYNTCMLSLKLHLKIFILKLVPVCGAELQ